MNHDTGLSRHIEEEVREKMKRYWQVYKPSIESMMLSHDAQYLAENEQNELLSYLPPYKDLNILELGAGIGRFTSRFALVANHVTAVDFMESYIKENEESNGHFENICFMCADVTKLDYPKQSFDLIFSNWLLMYLTTSEVEKLMQRVLTWLKPGGHFFFRESCYHQSGNVARTENPTKYRTPLEYIKMLYSTSSSTDKYVLKSTKSILTYIYYHGNPNQLCILAQKKEKNESSQKSEKHNILGNMNMENLSTTNERLKLKSILDVPSGENALKNLGVKLGLRGGQRVLQISCGMGEIAVFLSKEFEAFVHGIDSSPLNIHYAIEGQGKLDLQTRKKIQYEATDWTESDVSSEAYEVVLCYHTFFSKSKIIDLIRKAKTWLKHNGKLVLMLLLVNPEETTSQIEDKAEFLEESELENCLKSLSLTLQETKLESDLVLKYLRTLDSDISNHFNKTTKTAINEEIPTDFLRDLRLQITLLESKRLKPTRIIATK